MGRPGMRSRGSLIALVTVAGVAAWSAFATFGVATRRHRPAEPRPAAVVVPTLIGWEAGPAARLMKRYPVDLIEIPSGSLKMGAPGRILDQSPPPGTRLSPGEAVKVTVVGNGSPPYRDRSLRSRIGGVKAHATNRREVIDAMAAAGFLKALLPARVLGGSIRVVASGHLSAVLNLRTPSGRLRLTISNGFDPMYGAPVTVRGVDGAQQKDALLWQEDGYTFGVARDDALLVDELRWVPLS